MMSPQCFIAGLKIPFPFACHGATQFDMIAGPRMRGPDNDQSAPQKRYGHTEAGVWSLALSVRYHP